MAFSSEEILEEYLSSACVADNERYARLFAWSTHVSYSDRSKPHCKVVLRCKWCGTEFEHISHMVGRPKAFCSLGCKRKAMRERVKRLRNASSSTGQCELFA